ncbi:MAG: ricin-type beta-trefoil lectin domain protein [Pseudomonadota bacterium]
MRLVRFLDEPDGYCLDVPGPAGSELLEVPLVAHTCHPDPYADQVFRFNQNGSGEIRWTTEVHDLCFTPDAIEAGSRLHLRTCGEHPAQDFEYTEGQELKLTEADLCIHVERRGAGPRQPPGKGQDAYGRGLSVNAQYTHLMRFLELRTCGDGDASMFRWKAIQ